MRKVERGKKRRLRGEGGKSFVWLGGGGRIHGGESRKAVSLKEENIRRSKHAKFWPGRRGRAEDVLEREVKGEVQNTGRALSVCLSQSQQRIRIDNDRFPLLLIKANPTTARPAVDCRLTLGRGLLYIISALRLQLRQAGAHAQRDNCTGLSSLHFSMAF